MKCVRLHICKFEHAYITHGSELKGTVHSKNENLYTFPIVPNLYVGDILVDTINQYRLWTMVSIVVTCSCDVGVITW